MIDVEYENPGRASEQASRMRKLFAAVVMTAIDDAISENQDGNGYGTSRIRRWARSKDGREVLSCAGIDPGERAVQGILAFVERGIRTSVALSKEGRHALDV